MTRRPEIRKMVCLPINQTQTYLCLLDGLGHFTYSPESGPRIHHYTISPLFLIAKPYYIYLPNIMIHVSTYSLITALN